MEEEKLSQVLTSKNSDTASIHLSALHSDISIDRCQKIEDCTSKDESDCMIIESRTQKKAKELIKKMQQICVAPGEYGKFVNWKEDLFIEEKSFPEKFPFGIGGFLSTVIDDDNNSMGFADYCISQLMSCDPKFRNDFSYIFFLLLVKELILLKRCKTTYLRQARKLPNLSKNDIINIDNENLTRYNRSYEVFKNVRGTSMYYEQAKKNLMAILRQNGCPSLFLTLSCAEYDWPELLKEIVETVERRTVTKEYINSLSEKEKKRLISENVVQTSIHFQKRIDKLFALMKYDFFKGAENTYHISSYYYRVEFQQRGAPHIHALVWLKNQNDEDAPNFWINSNEPEEFETSNTEMHNKLKSIEKFADQLISTSSNDMKCDTHENKDDEEEEDTCTDCKNLREKVDRYQNHKHTFSCMKKKKFITVRANEGHGRLDGKIIGPDIQNIPVCRFNFPKYPSNETKVLLPPKTTLDEAEMKKRTSDLNKIRKYLLRQTNEENSCKVLKSLSFWEFLHSVGMFEKNKSYSECSSKDKEKAKTRYLNAISVSIKGKAAILLKRNVKDMFTNGYNKNLMKIQQSNMDIQVCIDHFAVAQYVLGYLTKNESGMSRLLKEIDDASHVLTSMEKLNALASILDKHREVSIQEAIYRLLGLPMTKSSVAVKYLSTVHPNYRDGLLKSNLEDLEENESIFHNSAIDYYENRPDNSDQAYVVYHDEELEIGYWDNISLTEFWSRYEVVYASQVKMPTKNHPTKIISLKNGSFVRRRLERAVIRYYLNYSNDEDLARGLLILFMPYRNEMEEIHQHDVKELLSNNRETIEEKREIFEKYRLMTDLVRNIQAKDDKETETENFEKEDIEEELESTERSEIENFNRWAKNQAKNDLKDFKNVINLCDMNTLRMNISSLNSQQRRLFDDVMERMIESDIDERPFCLFISGNAGTGKSYLVRLLIEAIKVLSVKSGIELQKPSVLVMAPTANSAFIVGGKTIDSALCFSPTDVNRYTQCDPARMAMMKFVYEDVRMIFVDEISMVGSSKLAKINYRLQDLAEGSKKKDFMGGISFIASGKYKNLELKKTYITFR